MVRSEIDTKHEIQTRIGKITAKEVRELARFQFVNRFPEWRGFYCFRLHKEESDMAYIYDWFLGFAFWEIRKWHKLTEIDKRDLADKAVLWERETQRR